MRTTLLHRALQVDAIVSGLLGVLLVAASGPVGRQLDLPAGFLLATGVFLLAWAAAVGWVGSRVDVPRKGAIAVIVLNFVWVADSVVLLLTDWVQPNGAGVAVVIAQAVAVLAVAELQYAGLRRQTRQTRQTTQGRRTGYAVGAGT